MKAFMKREAVLCIAAVLAAVSMLIVPPDSGYAAYVDVRVLALLFSLMIVMAGLQKRGIFQALASALVSRAERTGQLRLMLVFLCFFSAMLITNDVALITFVPFTIIIYTMAGQKEETLLVIVLQTIAANLGSMLTPLGNPQNLYLYSVSGMGMREFIGTMLPLTLLSGALLCICCLAVKSRRLPAGLSAKRPQTDEKGKFCIAFYVLLFVISLLAVLRILPYQIPLVLAVAGALCTDWTVLKKADYSLLLTFVCFFIFVGNMGRVEAVRRILSDILVRRELIMGFLCSQILSNVPTAVLLSGFTENWAELLKGVNIGGLGTLIASMASLISYKLYGNEEPERKGRYLLCFTGMNLLFAAVLLTAAGIA